ncbi:MAG TPA: hypothetical protein VES68_02455, partial [Candidatus Sulfotelmatobacter sp.]|nr:hypothetical protein [Candidatus Sulfotelmatobacter sp.]
MNIKKFLVASAAGALMFGSLAVGAFASTEVIYNNVPNPLPGNLSSEAFEAQSVFEFGGQVMFAGTSRTDPKVTVIMSSWGCESGH